MLTGQFRSFIMKVGKIRVAATLILPDKQARVSGRTVSSTIHESNQNPYCGTLIAAPLILPEKEA